MRKDSALIEQLTSDLRYLKLFTGGSSKQHAELEEAMRTLQKQLEEHPHVLTASQQ